MCLLLIAKFMNSMNLECVCVVIEEHQCAKAVINTEGAASKPISQL